MSKLKDNLLTTTILMMNDIFINTNFDTAS